MGASWEQELDALVGGSREPVGGWESDLDVTLGRGASQPTGWGTQRTDAVADEARPGEQVFVRWPLLEVGGHWVPAESWEGRIARSPVGRLGGYVQSRLEAGGEAAFSRWGSLTPMGEAIRPPETLPERILGGGAEMGAELLTFGAQGGFPLWEAAAVRTTPELARLGGRPILQHALRTGAGQIAPGAAFGAVEQTAHDIAAGEGVRPAEIVKRAGLGGVVAGGLGAGLGAAGALGRRRTPQRVSQPAAARPERPLGRLVAEEEALARARPLVPPQEAAAVDPLEKLVGALQTARRRLPGRARAVSELRAQQAARAGEAIEKYTGEEAAVRTLGALKGKAAGADFPALRPALEKAEINQIFERIRAGGPFHRRDVFSRVHAYNGMLKILNGELPVESELIKLEAIFGSRLIGALRRHRKLGPKVYETIVDAANIPRSLLASLDLSASGRQGGMLLPRRPKAWSSAFRQQLRVVLSEKNMTALQESIMGDPVYALAEQSGLYIAPWGEATRLAAREERFISRLADRIPGVRASNRAYVGCLNKFRMDSFKQYVRAHPGATPDELAAHARFINYATGRGELGRASAIGPELAAILFSPRYTASRFQVWGSLFTGPPEARKEAAKSMAAWIGAGVTPLMLAKLAGAKVESDPRSTEFGKIRIGNTRFDVWSGHQQGARYITQIATGQIKGSETGVLTQMQKGGRLSTLGRYARSKLAPAPALGVDILQQRDFLGREMALDADSVKRMARERLLPLAIQDTVDAYRQQGIPMAAPAAAAATLGVGVLSYEKRRVQWPDPVAREFQRLGMKPPQYVRKELKVAGEEKALRPEQRREYQRLADEAMLAAVLRTMNWAGYDALPDEGKRALLKRAMKQARTGVTGSVKYTLATEPAWVTGGE